jgi:hypothetical protein
MSPPRNHAANQPRAGARSKHAGFAAKGCRVERCARKGRVKSLVLTLALGSLACSAAAGAQPAQAADPSPSESVTVPVAAADSAPEAEPAAAPDVSGKHECNLLLGSRLASEWFNAGFEQVAGDRYWQAIFSPQALLQHWVDPAHAAWRQPLVSACMHNSDAPDHVVFVAESPDTRSREQWLQALTNLVETLKKKYPSLERIDLMTTIRGPKGASCGDARNAVAPYVDEAVDNVATNYPDLVKAAPKFEMDDCSAFKKGGAHFSEQGAAAAAKLVGEYFAGAED